MAKHVDASFDNQDPKASFVRSVKVDPLDFLTDGETPETAKTRIAAIVSEVVQKGLSMRDGELHFGVSPQDMVHAKTALGLLKGKDANYMRHSNDSLVNAMGSFVISYQNSQMGPAKPWETSKPENSLPQINMALGNMHERGFDKSVQPRRWDNCGGQLGRQEVGVSAQASMAGKGLQHLKA